MDNTNENYKDLKTEEKLDLLAELQAQRTLIDLDKQKAVDSVLTESVKAKLAEIEAEYSTMYDGVDAKIAALTDLIKSDVITGGASVKGKYLHAVFTKGRVSWDTKKLDGLMIAIPELAECRKEGEPSVSIRKI